MKCPNCKGKIEPGQKFCEHCGEEISEIKKGKAGKSGKPGKPGKKKLFIPVGIGALCILLVLVVGLVISPKQTTASKLQEKLNLGNNYLEKADYEKAKVAFQDALKIDEKSPEAALGMADAYNGQKKPDQALKYLKKASSNLETASKKKDTTNIPKDAQSFKTRYQKSCDNTSALYKQTSTPEKTKEVQEIKNYVINIEIPVITVKPSDNSNNTGKSDKSGKTSNNTSGKTSDDDDDDDDPPISENPADSSGNNETPTVTPEITVDPTISITPGVTEDPDVTVTPEITGEPDVTVTPEITGEPDVTVTPEITGVKEVTISPTPIETDWMDEYKYIEENEVTPTPTPAETDWMDEYIEEDTGIPTPGQEYVYNPSTGEDGYTEDSSYSGSETDSGYSEEYSEYHPENGEQDPSEMYPEENPSESYDDTTMSEESGTQESAEELLSRYVNETLSVQEPEASFSGSSVDAFSAGSVMNGRIGIQKEDLDKDGTPELLVISVQGGRLAFTVYKVRNGNVEQSASITAACDGLGTPLTDLTYGSTQECFIKDNGGNYIVGFASYLYGADAGDGTPAARTNLEAYQIGSDGSASRLCAATIQNGDAVYANGDATSAQSGGQDVFAGMLGAAGMSGSWNASNADTLLSMDLINDPWQDMSGLPNPIAGGLSEAGVQDLVFVNADMSAGSGVMNLSLQDSTSFAG